MKTTIKKVEGDLRIRVGYGTALFLLLCSFLLTLYANSELLKSARLVGYSNRVITDHEMASMTARYHMLNNVIFLSIGIGVLVAVDEEQRRGERHILVDSGRGRGGVGCRSGVRCQHQSTGQQPGHRH